MYMIILGKTVDNDEFLLSGRVFNSIRGSGHIEEWPLVITAPQNLKNDRFSAVLVQNGNKTDQKLLRSSKTNPF